MNRLGEFFSPAIRGQIWSPELMWIVTGASSAGVGKKGMTFNSRVQMERQNLHLVRGALHRTNRTPKHWKVG